jgi:peptide/nickel transport system substrate-binding protein
VGPLIALSLILIACGGPATTAAPAPTEAAPAATEAPGATEAPAPTEPPAEEKVLHLRLRGGANDLDPAFWPSHTDEAIMNSIGEGLVRYKPGTWEVENLLAETIEQSEDGLSIEFKLREGVQFHKGYGEVTAEDVKYSFERFRDPELAASYAGDWATLDHVEVTGTYTGIIHLTEPFAPLWTTTLPLGSGLVLSKAAIEEKGDEGIKTDPIGTGPYLFEERIPDQTVTLARNPDYWGEPGEWDTIVWHEISQDSAAEIALETGEVVFGEVSPEAYLRYESDPNFQVSKITGLDYTWLNANVASPRLADKNVRLAIRYAIDANEIIEAAYAGLYARACSMIAPGQIGHWADAPCYERDVDRAREYLAAAGLDSLDLKITVSNDEDLRIVAEVVQAQLAEVGINAEIEVLDGAAFGTLGEQVKERDLTVMGYSTNPDPSWSVVWFLCDQIDVWNWTYYCNPELDDLAHQAITELDPEKRTELYIELQRIWDEDAVAFNWISWRNNFFAGSPDVNPAMTPHSRLLAHLFTSK